MTERDGGDGKVGYGRPPKQYQFKKGQSGNRKGRPKADKNQSFLSFVHKAANEYVTIQEGGQRKKVTKLAVAAKQFVNKAASGDYRAAKLLVELTQSPVWSDINSSFSSDTVEDVRARSPCEA